MCSIESTQPPLLCLLLDQPLFPLIADVIYWLSFTMLGTKSYIHTGFSDRLSDNQVYGLGPPLFIVHWVPLISSAYIRSFRFYDQFGPKQNGLLYNRLFRKKGHFGVMVNFCLVPMWNIYPESSVSRVEPGELQSWEKVFVNLAKQHPGRARQKS